MFSHLQNGQQVIFILEKSFLDRTTQYLQPHNPNAQAIIATIVTTELSGVWIEKPNCKLRAPRTGNPIETKAHIYIPSHFIVSVVVFPDYNYVDESISEESKIGFV